MFNPDDENDDFLRAEDKVLKAKHACLQAIMSADEVEPEKILDLLENFICQIVYRELDAENAVIEAAEYEEGNLGI